MNRLLLTATLALVLGTACHRSRPEEEAHRLLTDRMLTLATAESCTGGTIAARFTAMPGASAYFVSGIVAYSLNAKRSLLYVCCDSVARHGMVSEPVVRQMAEGARRAAGTHYAIATTGIAGPTGGTPEQPVGTVWIAVSSPLGTTSRLIHARGNRQQIIHEAGTQAIELLIEELHKE